MNELLLGLALGVGAILLANLGLIRFARLSARQAAATVALIALGLYVPYGILRWPGGDVFAMHLAIYLLASLACGMLLGRRASGQGLHWGPALIGGFFIVVVVLGAVFIAVAEHGLSPTLFRWLLPEARNQREVSSVFPGVIAHDFHKKEALYNQYLQQVERQRQRGWQVQKGWLDGSRGGRTGGVPGGGAHPRGRTADRRDRDRAVSETVRQRAGCRVRRWPSGSRGCTRRL